MKKERLFQLERKKREKKIKNEMFFADFEDFTILKNGQYFVTGIK